MVQPEGALRALLAIIAGPAWVKDAEGRYLLINQAGARALRRGDQSEAIGRVDGELLPPELAEQRRRREQQVVSSGEALSFRETVPVAGHTRSYHTSVGPWRDRDGALAGLVGVCRDVTDHEHAEQELRRSLTLLRAVADGTTDVIYVKDLAGRYLLVNQAGASWLGLTADEVTGKHDADLFPPDLADAFRANDERVMASGEAETYEQIVPTEHGVQIQLSTKAPYRDQSGRIIGVIGVTRDITKRKQAEEERARLLARLGDLREEERHRLALELHDGPVQNLATVSLRLDKVSLILERQQPGDLEQAQQLVDELRDAVEAEIGDLRRMMSDLRPLLLDQQGLVAALRALVDSVRLRSGLVRCAVRVRLGEDDRLDATVETTLFRVAQQALANVAEHAAAREVNVTLERLEGDRQDRIVLRIEDDGRGFDHARLDADASRRGLHIGLDAMRERIQALGGKLEVESSVGSGTCVEARVPAARDRGRRSQP